MKRNAIWMMLCLSVVVIAQNPTELWFTQYKKENRNAFSDLEKGEIEKAVTYFKGYLQTHPRDAESWYGLALRHAGKQSDSTLYYIQQSILNGLPPERYYAGPYALNKPIFRTKEVRKYLRKVSSPLVHGPMLGKVTENSATIWVRTKAKVLFTPF